MAARTEHERAWYEQQAQRLNRHVQPLMLRWTQAYKVMPCKHMPVLLLTVIPLRSCQISEGLSGRAAMQQRDRGRDVACQPTMRASHEC